MLISKLPYFITKSVCEILDQNNKWEELGSLYMQYDRTTLDFVKKRDSPSNELLRLWSRLNHTVIELFVLLYRMEMYQAMTLLKDFVDNKYHIFIRNETADTAVTSLVIESRGVPPVQYKDLKMSTNGWAKNNIIGEGGYGRVYKGFWKRTNVAIKRIKQRNGADSIKQSMTELYCLNSYRHENILPIVGYCIEGPYACLIYQYMLGGSLYSRIQIRDTLKVLDWPQRLDISIGTARGLQFLHTHRINGKPLVHRDIKSANILLDSKDEPKIGDFGLAREGPQGEHSYIKLNRIQGTRPYLPDEFLYSNRLSTQVDTYSFGIVLFEIATGLTPLSNKREKQLLSDHVVNYEQDIFNLKDKRTSGFDNYFIGMLDIGKMCVQQQARMRPDMVQVLIWLETVKYRE